jgi:hypothetical protein
MMQAAVVCMAAGEPPRPDTCPDGLAAAAAAVYHLLCYHHSARPSVRIRCVMLMGWAALTVVVAKQVVAGRWSQAGATGA